MSPPVNYKSPGAPSCSVLTECLCASLLPLLPSRSPSLLPMNPTSPVSQASSSGPGEVTTVDARHGSGSASSLSLVENCSNYSKSAKPSKIFFYDKGSWVDFPCEVLESLQLGFVEGRIALKVELDRSVWVVDFLRMLKSNLHSGEERSIAWVDEEGKSFFPKRVVGNETGIGYPSRLDLRSKVEWDSLEEHSDESPEISSAPITEVGGSCDVYLKCIGNLFVTEMKKANRDVVVSSIRRCSHMGTTGVVRLRAFQARVECTKAVRGNANVRGAWYAGSLEELEGIVRYGFGRPNSDQLGEDAYGIGVHVIPPQALHSSCISPEADGNGEKHLLFCRVIMGIPEKAERGSKQFHPSSERFDSGADDFQNPKWYIVWSTHMNTHIIPECIVSFRPSGHRPQSTISMRKALSSLRRTYPPMPLTFLQLYTEMGKLLPPTTMKTLDLLFDRYKAKKLQKEVFVRHLRSIAGTNVICEAIKRMKDRV